MLSQYPENFSEIGHIIAYLGERKNGHLPAKCSIRMAINLSTDPKIAL
jgi:hypothetical protein